MSFAVTRNYSRDLVGSLYLVVKVVRICFLLLVIKDKSKNKGYLTLRISSLTSLGINRVVSRSYLDTKHIKIEQAVF